MYFLICAVNSYLYDISMECKVYMNSSLPTYQYIMQSSVVILGTYSGLCNKLSSTVVSAFAWHARGRGFDPQLGKI